MRKEKVSTQSAKIQIGNRTAASFVANEAKQEAAHPQAPEKSHPNPELIAAALGESGPEPLILDRFDIHATENPALARRLNNAYQTAMAVSGLAEVVRAHLLDCSPIYNALAPRQVGALLSAISLLGNSLADSLDRLADTIEKRTAEKKGGA